MAVIALGRWLRRWLGKAPPVDDEGFRLRHPVPSEPALFASALVQSVAARMDAGHRVVLLNNGDVFDRRELELRRARSSVNVVMYI